MDPNKTYIYELLDALRLPMMIGIIYCHTHFFKYISEEQMSQLVLTNSVIYTCYWLIGKIFTPTFFFISGYLFFRQHKFDWVTYKEKLKRRLHSLLIPYIIWNALMLAIMIAQEQLTGSTSARMGCIAEYGIKDYLYAFYDCTQNWSFIGEVGQPANIPLWFLRDLMFLVLASPLFFIATKTKKWLMPSILFMLYCCPYHLPHLQNLSIFWFGMGVWSQMNDIDLVVVSRKLAKWCLPIFCVAAFAHELIPYLGIDLPFDFIVPIMRVSEFPLLIALTAWIMSHTNKRIPQKISKGSFFIYLSHIVPTSALCLLACRLLPITDIVLTASYLVIPWIVTFLLISVYLLLSNYMPRTMHILTGNR
ncbi:MAG: acyltransferase [Paludibacteraceae bacterium]|nr:acyltransferase [Paludibacteraceae bacterium]